MSIHPRFYIYNFISRSGAIWRILTISVTAGLCSTSMFYLGLHCMDYEHVRYKGLTTVDARNLNLSHRVYSFCIFVCEVEHGPAVTLMVKICQMAPLREIKL